jgi:hypothetical protein
MNNIEYGRLLDLKNKISHNQATAEERKEYMTLLYRNGNITKDQYDKFLSNQNAEDIVKAGLTIGGVILATWLLLKLTDK